MGSRFPKTNGRQRRGQKRKVGNSIGMNAEPKTERRGEAGGRAKLFADWPPRSWFVLGHANSAFAFGFTVLDAQGQSAGSARSLGALRQPRDDTLSAGQYPAACPSFRPSLAPT